KQISATIVIVLVKKVSIPADVLPFYRKKNGGQLRRYDAGGGRNAIKKLGKSSRNSPESGRHGQFVGLLDVGNDIGRFPQRIGLDRLQGDGPVALVALAAAGQADDLEFDTAAQRMPIERKHYPPGDL